MAILVSEVVLDTGITVNNSYANIGPINGNKDSVQFNLDYYVSLSAYLERKPLFKSDIYQFQPSVEDDSPNFIKQCYLHLKSLPEFVEAIDA